MKKYVWLNLTTGEFSNSWSEEEMKKYGPIMQDDSELGPKTQWKLIEYTCISDPDFHFYNMMKLK